MFDSIQNGPVLLLVDSILFGSQLDPNTKELKRNFAITQAWNCASDKNVAMEQQIRGEKEKGKTGVHRLSDTWKECDHRPDNTQYVYC